MDPATTHEQLHGALWYTALWNSALERKRTFHRLGFCMHDCLFSIKLWKMLTNFTIWLGFITMVSGSIKEQMYLQYKEGNMVLHNTLALQSSWNVHRLWCVDHSEHWLYVRWHLWWVTDLLFHLDQWCQTFPAMSSLASNRICHAFLPLLHSWLSIGAWADGRAGAWIGQGSTACPSECSSASWGLLT